MKKERERRQSSEWKSQTKAWANNEGEVHLFLWLMKELGNLPVRGAEHQHINPTILSPKKLIAGS